MNASGKRWRGPSRTGKDPPPLPAGPVRGSQRGLCSDHRTQSSLDTDAIGPAEVGKQDEVTAPFLSFLKHSGLCPPERAPFIRCAGEPVAPGNPHPRARPAASQERDVAMASPCACHSLCPGLPPPPWSNNSGGATHVTYVHRRGWARHQPWTPLVCTPALDPGGGETAPPPRPPPAQGNRTTVNQTCQESSKARRSETAGRDREGHEEQERPCGTFGTSSGGRASIGPSSGRRNLSELGKSPVRGRARTWTSQRPCEEHRGVSRGWGRPRCGECGNACSARL